MSNDNENPILPSEPLSLQPDLINEAVQQASLETTNGHREDRSRSRSRSLGQRPLSHSRSRSRDRYMEDRRERRYRSPSFSPGYEGRKYSRNEEAPHPHPHPHPHSHPHPPAPEPSRVLGIFGMSKFTGEHNLRELFSEFGEVEKVQIIRDPYEGRSRGFAFINMAAVEAAQKAKEALNGSIVHERKVRVDYSFTSHAHSRTPGKYKGQDTHPPARDHSGHRRNHYPPRREYYRDEGHYRHGYHPRRRANTRDRRRRDQYFRDDMRRRSPEYYDQPPRHYREDVRRRYSRSPPPPPAMPHHSHPPHMGRRRSVSRHGRMDEGAPNGGSPPPY